MKQYYSMRNNREKIALVTGACGFMGTHMVDLLVSRGYRVRATDLPGANRKYLNKSRKVEFIPADITKKESMPLLLIGVEKVFHLAALFKFGAPWKLLYKVNVEGTRNLCEAALNFPIKRIVIWSSGTVYGKTKKKAAKESAHLAHVGRYEWSKVLQGRLAFKFYKEKGLPITVLRPAAAYGPRGEYGIAFLIFLMARNLLPVIPGKREFKGALVHVRDVVGAAEYLSDKKEAIGQTYNINDDLSAVYDKKELLFYVAELLGKKIYNFSIPLWLIYPSAEILGWWANLTGKRTMITKEALEYLAANYIMDNAKIKRAGYKLLYPDPRAGLKETIEWYRKEKWI